MQIAEVLPDLVQSAPFTYDQLKIPCTISLGVACLEPGGEPPTPTAMIAKADANLYEAKRSGRNRAVG